MRLSLFAPAFLFCALLPLTAYGKDVGYSLELGDAQVVGQYTLKEGIISVGKKGSMADGLQIIVPPGAFSSEQTFSIRSAKVKKSNVPDYVISPLISVTGPLEPSNGFMMVKIPCRVPENSMAMIFFYDEKDKFTRSLPPGPDMPGYVTGMTRVLKDMVVVAKKVGGNAGRKQ